MKHLHKLLGGLMILAIIGVMFALPSDMTAPTDSAGRSALNATGDSQEAPAGDNWISEAVSPVLTQEVRDLPPYVVKPELDREINPRLTTDANFDPNSAAQERH